MQLTSLKRVLVVPFILLVLSLAVVIYWASHRSADYAGQEFSQRVLLDMVGRVTTQTESHLSGARVALNTVVPNPIYSPADYTTTPFLIPSTVEDLERQLWVATGFFPAVNNYAYFGGADGSFVGILRAVDHIELRLREPGANTRKVYSVGAPGKRLGLLRTDNYDPRTRPWYKTALVNGQESWSSVYTDFTTREPTITLSKPAYGADHQLVGVAATDLSLSQLTDFFSSLSVSRHGVAFVVERSGAIIATSTNELPYRVENDALVRLMAGESVSPLLRQAYEQVLQWQRDGDRLETPVSREFETDMGVIQVGASLLRDTAGLEWITVVAIPRADFIGNVSTVFYESFGIAFIAVLLLLALGSGLLHWVLTDIRKLTNAAESIGQGRPLAPLDIRRADEIGVLAKSLQEMERNLRTDKLTGVLNRQSLVSQIEFRASTASEVMPLKFALLFVDLDFFKQVNDEHGHDAGDKVLIEIAGRLKKALRADDEVARFGGDEFVVYLHGMYSAEDIGAVRAKLLQVIAAPVEVGPGIACRVGASIGWAQYPGDGMDIDALLKKADQRMFERKKARVAG
ncbi:diguanylate cyclase [Noviherbaspirillum sp.]|uniref:bifunctional diguanylate cyclase/phosphodiesterase n=1 Tax=Noviherbaspirillum sp. TaxID=1926288 RepID=UPI002D25C0EE|nr:diguanylate cyclase [Noviherbaspirillum sp.]HZW23358.1 diguanylate cyclase [Noviherbaspirillum sp.]